MKKILNFSVVILMLLILTPVKTHAAEAFRGGDTITADTSLYLGVWASSSTVVFSTAVASGIQRMIVNHSDTTIYKTQESYSVAVTTTNGIPIYARQTYIEDRYFGNLYFVAENGSSDCDVRVEATISKY